MAKGEKSYEHKGWLGRPLESDFQAQWGLIPRAKMFDARGTYPSVRAATADAIEEGYDYILAPRASKRGNRLYHIGRSSNVAICVYAELDYLKRAAEAARKRYQDPAKRLVHLIRVHMSPSERDAILGRKSDLIARIEAGVCEVTGLAFSDKIDNGFTPAIAKRDPKAAFSYDNALVVVAMCADLLERHDRSQVEAFLRAYADRLSDRS